MISLQSKGLLRVFSNTTVQKHQFFSAQISYCYFSLVVLVTFTVLMLSNFFILFVFRAYSVESRSKALYTGSSHTTVVPLFFTPESFTYIRPATTFPEDKTFALFYTIIAPIFKPLIYMLRNTEMRNAFRKFWRPHVLLERK